MKTIRIDSMGLYHKGFAPEDLHFCSGGGISRFLKIYNEQIPRKEKKRILEICVEEGLLSKENAEKTIRDTTELNLENLCAEAITEQVKAVGKTPLVVKQDCYGLPPSLQERLAKEWKKHSSLQINKSSDFEAPSTCMGYRLYKSITRFLCNQNYHCCCC